jgi:pyruvate/2-oxoacid:ferredoxin oxidoreductase alpha subunit
LSDAINDGQLHGEFIAVESEHAAMSGAIGASVSGARTFTATAAHGLLYMMEMVYWAGYGRLPMTMTLVNRALAPGWSIWVDHQDLYSMRDTGWLQLVAKNNQEAYDMIFQSYKISEDHGVYLPSAVNIDGFVLSHVAGQVVTLDQQTADDFLPAFDPMFALDPADPVSFGNLTLPEDYQLLRQDLLHSMERAKKKILDVSMEFAEITGREWGDLVEIYGPETADVCVIAMGTMAEEVEEAVDFLNERNDGCTYGAVRIRSFRPFPVEEIIQVSKNYDQFIVLERGFSFGSDPPLMKEIRNALYEVKDQPPVVGRVIGYGGADVSYKQLMEVITDLKEDN